VPSWRATKDISIKDDLVEEVGRMIGYDSITPAAPLVPAGVPPASPERLFHRGVRAMMAAQGYTEVSNYSFVSEDQARALGMDPAVHVAVANPISSDQSLMRKSLLPGIRKNILDNSRHFDSFRLFEIGREIRPGDKLPVETPFLAAAVYAKDDGVAGLLELKRAAECLMPGASVKPAEGHGYEHPARAADVEWRGETVGRLFEFHPSVIEEGRGAVLYVNLETMFRLSPSEKRYQPQRRYPSSEFDLSVVAGLRELAGDLESKLRSNVDPVMLERIDYLRQFSGPPLPDGVKSVSFRLRVGSPEKTLSSDEVAQIRTAIIEGMRSLGYDLRV
jgi:phenylalanyl-tRNA synthetase beta chain